MEKSTIPQIAKMRIQALDDTTKERYRKIYYWSNILFLFWSFLLLAQLYTQSGYPNYYINYLQLFALVILVVNGIYQRIHNKGYYEYISYEVAPYKKWKSKFLKVMLFAGISLDIAILAARFFLPDQIVYYMQNILYVSAFIVLICSILFISSRH